MNKIATTIILCVSFMQLLFAQQNSGPISVLKSKFESFDYNEAISYADSLLTDKSIFSNSEQVQIYLVKGVSQFSLLNYNGAENSFNNILKINPNYILDSASVSPKIISFFNNLKSDFEKKLAIKNESVSIKTDTVYLPKIINKVEPTNDLKQAILRSVIFPGLGHFYLNENTKGWILTSLSAITLASSIYFIIDSNKKEKNYLNETNPGLIQQKYNSYNSSYKIKNVSIISFVAVWLYSQIDILFFPHHFYSNDKTISLTPSLFSQFASNLQLNFQLEF
ncbi:MAG TPA: hypothetical protein VMV32_10180 [Ignavibacteriaceae bacterium]|nr:hypothetical protein [Ignavibacteriaceae bacterium]